MSTYHTGNIQPQLDLEEHVGLARAKRVVIVGNDGGGYNEMVVNADGSINGGGGGGGGVQYLEGATDASVTGTAIMWRDVGDSMEPVTSTTPLPVNVVAGGTSGTTFDDGDAIDTDSQGTLLVGATGVPGTARIIQTANDGSVRIDPTGVTAQPVTDNGGSLTVDGPLTDTELRATPVPVSGTVSVTEPVSVDDNGGSLTIDGTVAVSAVGGTVTIQDGGNVITVDGTVAVTQSTSPWVVSGAVTVAPERSTAGTPAGFTISTAAVLVAASNASRRAMLMVNFGSSNIFIGHTNAVTVSGAAAGLKLVPNGSYQDSGDGLYTGDLYAIGDAVSASQNLSASQRT